jgi:hypothetical protein
LGAAEKFTSDVPPEAAGTIVSQGAPASGAVVQVQTPGAVTVTLPLPPPYGTDAVVDPRRYVQVVPDCDTPTDCPAIVNRVDRAEDDAELAGAVTFSVALPTPEVGATVAHAAPLDAVHEQFDPFAVTLTAADPPACARGLASAEASSVTLHGVAS